MLYWASVFFLIALIAAVLGFGGIAAGAAGIAKILFFIFLVAFVVSLLMGVFRRSVERGVTTRGNGADTRAPAVPELVARGVISPRRSPRFFFPGLAQFSNGRSACKALRRDSFE